MSATVSTPVGRAAAETFNLSKDPLAEEKIRDVVGLYLNSPTNAVVLSLEKTQIQVLDLTQAVVPLRPNSPARQTHDYRRNGLTSLLCCTGDRFRKVLGECTETHYGADFLHFLKGLSR